MSEPSVLLEDVSPNGNVSVIVEQDDRVACMYLLSEVSGERQVKSCWLRNLKEAPEQLDAAAMREGVPPLMPRAHCRLPQGAPPLQPDDLKVVWSEEGDAAALYLEGDLFAVMPSWSGENDFDGFARDCIGQGHLAWELGDRETNASFRRYEVAAEYWASWEKVSFWPDYQTTLLNLYEAHLGKSSRYFAIDGGNWPPKALAVFQQGTCTILTSIGIGMRSQPSVELHSETPSQLRRFELGGCYDQITDEEMKSIGSYMSGQSGLPWSNNTWLGSGHTMPSDVFSSLSGGRFSYALLMNEHPLLPDFSLPDFRGDPVTLLWMIPISESERVQAMNHGSRQLWEALKAQCSSKLGSFRRHEVTF